MTDQPLAEISTDRLLDEILSRDHGLIHTLTRVQAALKIRRQKRAEKTDSRGGEKEKER